jgi:hypothetical protein
MVLIKNYFATFYRNIEVGGGIIKQQTYQSAQANLCTMVHLQWQRTEIATGMAKFFCNKERCSSPFFLIFHQQRLVKIADMT